MQVYLLPKNFNERSTESRLVERQLEKMKTLTHSFQVGTSSSICEATKRNITTNTIDNKEDGVTKPFSRAFCEKLGQVPGHSEVLLCSQMCQYSRVLQKGDTPLEMMSSSIIGAIICY